MSEVPVVAAATVVLLANRPGLEVALLTRRKASVFVGGMTVFPGGGVDQHDRDPAWESGDFPASTLLPLPHPLSYWVAGIRETWEEANVFLGDPAPDAAQRSLVDSEALPFLHAVQSSGAILDFARLAPVGRWITPAGSPRRYDTIFFVAKVDHSEGLEVDGREAVESQWSSPADALAALDAGDRLMLPPTSVTLDVISGYKTADDVIRAARSAAPIGDAHRLMRVDGDPYATYFLPGEEYPTHAVPAEGWISLPPANPKKQGHR